MHPYDFIFLGLAIDLVGAAVLAKGFIFKNPLPAYYKSLMIVGGNPFILSSVILQRGEACLGAFLLVLGFFLQIWGNLHGGIEASEPGWINSLWRMLLVLGGVIAVVIVTVCLVTWNARIQFYRVFFHDVSAELKATPTPDDETWHDRMCLVVGLRRHGAETDAELLARIQRRWTDLAKQYGGK